MVPYWWTTFFTERVCLVPINVQHMLFPFSVFHVLQMKLNESYPTVSDHCVGTKNWHMVSIWITHSALRNLWLILASIHMKTNSMTEHCGEINSTLVLFIKIRIIFHIMFGFFWFICLQTYIYPIIYTLYAIFYASFSWIKERAWILIWTGSWYLKPCKNPHRFNFFKAR